MSNVSNPPIIYPVGQSSPSRVFGTVYHNTKNRPLYVNVICSSTAVGLNSVYALCDATVTPAIGVAGYFQDATVAGARGTISFIVLPGYYYSVTLQSGAMSQIAWIEWI